MSGSRQLRVLLAGGSGFVGKHLTRALLGKGHKVTWVSRSPTAPADLPGVAAVTWSEIKEKGLPPSDAVCNLSGQPIIDFGKSWNDSFKDLVYRSRIDTTKALATAIEKAPPQERPSVLVATSAIGYYGARLGIDFDEQGDKGDDFLAKICADVEQAASAVAKIPVRHVAFRLGIVLGKGGGPFQSMYLPFYLGVGGPFGSGKQPFPWVHVHDVAQAYIQAIENPEFAGVYNLVAPDLVSNGEFSQKLASAMWRPALLPFPGFVLNFALGPERASMLLTAQRVIPKRLVERSFPYKFPTVDSAVKELISW